MKATYLHLHPESYPDVKGTFLTLVVPAQSCCNLRRSFCLVHQRQKITETRPNPENCARFIREVAEQERRFALVSRGCERRMIWVLPSGVIASRARFLDTSKRSWGICSK